MTERVERELQVGDRVSVVGRESGNRFTGQIGIVCIVRHGREIGYQNQNIGIDFSESFFSCLEAVQDGFLLHYCDEVLLTGLGYFVKSSSCTLLGKKERKKTGFGRFYRRCEEISSEYIRRVESDA